MKAILSLFLILITFLTEAQDVTNNLRQIDSIIESKIQNDHPGLGVGIVKDGEIIYEKYRGLSNLQHQIPFSEKTRSNIASTAKQFTALMILDLSLKGDLNLEDDVRLHLPKIYTDVKQDIKIRHLLNHTSGIRDYVELLDMEGEVWWKRFGLGNDHVMELLQKQKDLGFDPGTKYNYSNSNYIVLAKIIEVVTGESFNSYSKKYFKALGMNETSFVKRYMGVIPNRANPYSDWGRGEWWEVPTVTKTNGEGFLFTTLKDQLIYEQLIQNAIQDHNELLIKSQQPIPNSEITSYGFGLELKDRIDRTAVHHSGGTYGFHSQTLRFPEESLTVFILSNNGNISSNLIAQEIAKTLLPKIEKTDKYQDGFYQTLNASTANEDVQIIGQYDYQNSSKLVRIVKNNDQIFWKEGDYFNLRLISESKNIFKFENNPRLKVVFYKDRLVEYYPSGKTISYSRNADASSKVMDLESYVGTYYNSELNLSIDLNLTENNTLKLKYSNDENSKDVEVYNRNYLYAGSNYIIKPKRDTFDRITEVLLTYGRAENIRFIKKSNLKFQPKIATEDGYIQVTTIGSRDGDASDILLTKNYPNGNEIWSKRFGGNSYDKASSIIATDDGYLIIGSTSSYGKGNYDMFVIKTNKVGKKMWQNTYGMFYNEYGFTAEISQNGYLVKGTTQNCENNTDINRKCTTNVWFVEIDKSGNEISNSVLEEID